MDSHEGFLVARPEDGVSVGPTAVKMLGPLARSIFWLEDSANRQAVHHHRRGSSPC